MRWRWAQGGRAVDHADALGARRSRLLHLHLGHRRPAQGRDADPRQHHRQPARRLGPAGAASASATRCSCRSCRCRTPTSTRPGQFLPIAMGAQIYYAEGADTLSANLVEARPTILTCVPRLYEVLRQRIVTGVAAAGRHQRAAVQPGAGARASGAIARAGCRRIWPLVDRLLDPLVRRKVRHRFGGRLKAMVSGGAPLNLDVGLFFHALGLPVLQGYGQTEAAPVISANLPGRAKLDTVGPAAGRGRDQDRRGRRDPGPRRPGHARLLEGRGGDGPGAAATAGCTPATSARWTPTAISGSPTARRT